MATIGQLKRLCEKVVIDHGGTLTNGTPCWLYSGSKFKTTGYAAISRDSRTQTGHRWLWLAVSEEEVVPGRVLDHLCRVRHCVNPRHVEQVTEKVNINRGDANVLAREKPRCVKGHLLSGDNLHIGPRQRVCRACRAAAGRRYRKRKWEGASEEGKGIQRAKWSEQNKRRRAEKKDGT